MPVGAAGLRLRGILSAIPMHLVQVFGLQVVRLELLVSDGPGWRDASVVLKLAEILLPKPEQRRAVELRVPAHCVVRVRVKRVPLPVVPELLRLVTPLDIDQPRIPVGLLASDEVAPFQQEDAFPGGRQGMGQSATSGTGPDDDDVEVVHGVEPPEGPRAGGLPVRCGRGLEALRVRPRLIASALPGAGTST